MNQYRNPLLLIFASLSWGGVYVVGRYGLNEGSAVWLTLWRWGPGALIFFGYLAFFRRDTFSKIFSNFWILLLIAAIGIAFFPATIFLSVAETTALNAALYIAATPAIIMLFSALLYRSPIGKLGWLTIALGLSGTLVLLFRGDLSALASFSIAWNDKWAVISALSWSAYCLILPLRPVELDGAPFLGAIVIIGVAILIPVALWQGLEAAPLPNTPTIGFSLLYMAIFPSILAYLAWNAGSQEIGRASCRERV